MTTEKLPPAVIEPVETDMTNDLIAAFALKQDEILDMLDRAESDGWTFDRLMEEVNASTE